MLTSLTPNTSSHCSQLSRDWNSAMVWWGRLPPRTGLYRDKLTDQAFLYVYRTVVSLSGSNTKWTIRYLLSLWGRVTVRFLYIESYMKLGVCLVQIWILVFQVRHLNICLNSNQSDILRQRNRNVELKKYCVTLLEKFGSLSYRRQTLEEVDGELGAEVAKLGGNPLLEDALDELLDWKRDTDDKNTEQWGFCVAANVVSTVHVWLAN